MKRRVLGIALRAGALSFALLAPTVVLAQPVTAPALGGADLLSALRAGRSRESAVPHGGDGSAREGEADVVRPRGADFEVLARVGLKQWRDLAAVPAGR
jgi:hypothetical protein